MSEIPKWQASIHFLYPGEATSGRLTVYLAADVDAAIAAAEQRGRDEQASAELAMREQTWAAALTAAREAVAAVPAMNATVDILTGQDVHEIWREDALAAIDALKDTHITTDAP